MILCFTAAVSGDVPHAIEFVETHDKALWGELVRFADTYSELNMLYLHGSDTVYV
jgi:hypothetical protein